MVLDLDGEPLLGGVEARAFWHRPALEHPVEFQTKVEMKPARLVLLNNKSKRRRGLPVRRQLARWLRRFPEIALAPVLFERHAPGLLRRQRRRLRLCVELAQARQDLLGEERNISNRVGVVEKATLAEHQQIAEAADAVAQRLDLIVHVIRRARETGAALDQLIDCRCSLIDRIAVAVPDKAAAPAARLEHSDIGSERVVARWVGERLGD